MIHKSKKSLGQNFLKSSMALRKIIEAGEVSNNDTILEIGPGKGVLTEKLLEKAKVVIAVEKDRELFAILQNKFAEQIKSGSLVLIHDDILNFNIESYQQASYKLIANIPYNITGAILKKFLTAQSQPERMILMVQLEVARRIVASDSKESILSISVKAYGKPKIVCKVPARYFSPSPKVDSAVIVIYGISKNLFTRSNLVGGERINEEKFWEIVKAGFSHKRKKLGGNLKNLCLKEDLKLFADKRAENLTLLDWISLAR
ncbi:ribosomal RNA small subunit methyltransferase A [Candidatus Nomurabacteria bacterium RIFCSPLOWO2_01_FULL_40_15]|uniref:Ribosomal RNA small subunit methyltransferase A n=1 Tax=Candidatus Nomurabacteria bacterium RIFCSPLOWO2_01_FULL_40_15 TaxID=1801772 RepID=A0A1F6XAC2_9BACT|nr:MAG: ribosomal RNA small subunit methyltransferase A [Candidatus Nomurabacteria bacterium RIFCSPLOWO2_01_FULL_40_15]